jgi:uncharacterized membrane protein (GlpM family)
MDIKLLALYFIIGGLTVAVVAYLGARGQGLLAAFATLFPGVTLITFLAIYFQSGTPAVVSYARGMLILLPPWIVYILSVMFLIPRLGLFVGLPISVALYVVLSLLIIKLTS